MRPPRTTAPPARFMVTPLTSGRAAVYIDDRVKAPCTGYKGVWPGAVAGINQEAGTLHIEFDDGDEDFHVPIRLVRHAGGASATLSKSRKRGAPTIEFGSSGCRMTSDDLACLRSRLWTARANDGQMTAVTVCRGGGDLSSYGKTRLGVRYHNKDNQGGKLDTISHLHHAKDAMRYAVLFPHGDDGYHLGLRQQTDKPNPARVSHVMYGRYQLHERNSNSFPTSRSDTASRAEMTRQDGTVAAGVKTRRYSVRHRGGKLFGEHLLDLYLAAESSRMLFMRLNQTTIRADLYENIFTNLHNGVDRPPGKQVILAPSFTTGGRHYAQVLSFFPAPILQHHAYIMLITCLLRHASMCLCLTHVFLRSCSSVLSECHGNRSGTVQSGSVHNVHLQS